MESPLWRKIICCMLLVSLLQVSACATAEPWYKGKPVSQMTPAELEEQDPLFWPEWGHLHGLGP